MATVTKLLESAGRGDVNATDVLFAIVYDELKKMAARRMACESSGNTLQTTALVNEAYLRLAGNDPNSNPAWQNRFHFFMAASEAMRRILIDSARKRKRLKRGGDGKRIELDESHLRTESVSDELLDLDAAIRKLEQHAPQKAELVKLRFYGGMTSKETAEILNIGLSTAERYWTYARAWLKESMEDNGASFESP